MTTQDDYSDIPTMWQWRFVLLRDGTLRLYETYWNGDRLLAYRDESQLFDAHDADRGERFFGGDAFAVVSRAMELPVLHVDQLPPNELKDSTMAKILRRVCKTVA